MGILLEKFRNTVNSMKDKRMQIEGDTDIAYSTGFLPLDAINSYMVDVNNKETGEKFEYCSAGITSGTGCMLIGRSGCGKTTLAIQIAKNIVGDKGDIFHDDIESGSIYNRRKVLTGWTDEHLKNNYRYRNTGITAESFFKTLSLIHKIKMENYDNLVEDTGYLDPFGNHIMKLPPTCYILDSIPMLMPEKFADEEELSGQMAVTAGAKTNSMIFKRIIPMLKSANIILITINHITDDIAINPMQRKKAPVAWVKSGESLPGGKAVTYLANLMIRLDDNTKLKPDEGLGISGSLVDAQFVKSRSGKASSVCTLVFNQDSGFDPDLSLFILLKNEKKINGAGAYLYIGDHSEKKFRQSEIKKKLNEDEEFRKIFMEACNEVLSTKINTDPTELEDINHTSSNTGTSDEISSNFTKIIKL